MSAIQLKPSQLRAFLAAAIAAREPVLIQGPPGVGKSDISKLSADDASADFVLMHPAVQDSTYFSGMPWVSATGATFLPFGEMQKLIGATRLTVCLFDDLGQAPNSVQAAAMQLFLARQINGRKVSDFVVFLAATNRRTDRAGVSGILEPVKGRFTIVELVPDLRELSIHLAANGGDPKVIAFLNCVPDAVQEFVATADITNSPNPRNWEAVSRWSKLNLPANLRLAAYAGRVGEGRGGEFCAFERTWADMVNPDLVLNTPDTAPIPTEPSALYALCLAISHKVTSASMGRFCRYLERLLKAGRNDFAAVAMQCATARDAKLANTDGYITAMTGDLGSLMLGVQS